MQASFKSSVPAAMQIQELLSAEGLKDEFIAVLGHELLSPLVAVQHAMRILNGDFGEDPHVRRRTHALIERQVRQMLLLTAGLRDISQLARGQLRLQRERIDLRRVLADALETMAPQLQQRAHVFATRWPDEPVWLLADADRLDQVFRNLLGNASKFTQPGGELNLSLQVNEHQALVRVRDGGIGIDAAALPHIFKMYMQGDQGPTGYRPGLGIGLALVQMLVELHGGRVAAVSAGVGLGSEFTVRLPLADCAGQL